MHWIYHLFNSNTFEYIKQVIKRDFWSLISWTVYQPEHEACQRSLLTLINWINPKGWWSFPVHSHSKCISYFTLDRLVSGAGNTQIWPTQHKHTPPPLKSCIQSNSRKSTQVLSAECTFSFRGKMSLWTREVSVLVQLFDCNCDWSSIFLLQLQVEPVWTVLNPHLVSLLQMVTR